MVEPVATITKQHKDGSAETEQSALPAVLVDAPNATVGCTMGVTRNLGNYESVKITVHLSVPCANEEGTINEAYGKAKAWVDEKMAEINKDIDEQLS